MDELIQDIRERLKEEERALEDLNQRRSAGRHSVTVSNNDGYALGWIDALAWVLELAEE